MDGKNMVVDAAALVAYLVVANPAMTGIAAHEWLAIGVLAVLFVHFATHVDWAVEAVRGAFGNSSFARRGNLALDALLLVALMVAMVSGLMVSGAVLSAFGLYADGYYFWDPLHAISAKVLLALLLVHVAVHWKWLYNFFRKRKRGDEHGTGADGQPNG